MANNPVFSRLLRAGPMNWFLYAEAREVKDLVRDLVAEIIDISDVYNHAPTDRRGLSDSVQLLVLNILRLRYSDPKRLLAFPRGKAAYDKKPISHSHAMRTFKGLIALKLVSEKAPGFQNRDTGKSFVTRLEATNELFTLCEQAGVKPRMVRVKERRRLVELRGKKSSKSGISAVVPWPRKAKSEQTAMDANLRVINSALENSMVLLHVADDTLDQIQDQLERKKEEHRWIDFFNKSLYRVFHDRNTHLGGRFHGGWWQGIPRAFRKHIHMCHPGGHPSYTFELDYSAIQPRILYAEEKFDYLVPTSRYGAAGRDPYSIYGFEPEKNKVARGIVKTLFLQMLNASSRESALSAAQNEIRVNFDLKWRMEHPEIRAQRE